MAFRFANHGAPRLGAHPRVRPRPKLRLKYQSVPCRETGYPLRSLTTRGVWAACLLFLSGRFLDVFFRRLPCNATDRADDAGTILHIARFRRRRMLCRDRQINVAGRTIGRLAPSLDDRILQGSGELPFEFHARQLRPGDRRSRCSESGRWKTQGQCRDDGAFWHAGRFGDSAGGDRRRDRQQRTRQSLPELCLLDGQFP